MHSVYLRLFLLVRIVFFCKIVLSGHAIVFTISLSILSLFPRIYSYSLNWSMWISPFLISTPCLCSLLLCSRLAGRTMALSSARTVFSKRQMARYMPVSRRSTRISDAPSWRTRSQVNLPPFTQSFCDWFGDFLLWLISSSPP